MYLHQVRHSEEITAYLKHHSKESELRNVILGPYKLGCLEEDIVLPVEAFSAKTLLDALPVALGELKDKWISCTKGLPEWYANCAIKFIKIRSENNELSAHVARWRDIFEDRFRTVINTALRVKHDARLKNEDIKFLQRPDMQLRLPCTGRGNERYYDFLLVEIAQDEKGEGEEHKDLRKLLGMMQINLEQAMQLAWRGAEDADLMKYLKVGSLLCHY